MALPTALQIETASLTAWPALLTAFDGHWVWRAARGYSGRANSMQCLDPADGANAAARIARFTDLYTRHGLRPIFKITPLTAPEILSATEALEWKDFNASHVLAATLHPHPLETRHHTVLFEPTDPAWHDAQAEMSGYSALDSETVRMILERIACDSRGVLAYDENGVPAAAALAAVANGVAIFGNVVSRTSHRGRGYGRAAMAAALNWARDAGATGAGIQVAGGNAVAIRLYASLGFVHAYDYRYRRPRSAP